LLSIAHVWLYYRVHRVTMATFFSGVHSIMMEKVAQAGEGGCTHTRGLQFYTFLEFQ
jgi:hypothetical protein